MNTMTKVLGICMVLLATDAVGAEDKRDSGTVAPAASVPFQCNIKRGAWCIRKGWVEITQKQRMDGSEAPGTTWVIQDRHYPESSLVVIEPIGCESGYADTVEAKGFSHGLTYDGRIWDSMVVRLRRDGTCDLKLLVTPFRSEAAEWGFFEGRTMVAACGDRSCSAPLSPTPADVTAPYRSAFRGEGR